MRKTILHDIQSIQNLLDTVWSVEALPEVLQEIVDRTAELIRANRVSLIVFDLSKKSVEHFLRGGPGRDRIDLGVPFEELWGGLSGWVLRQKRSALSPKNRRDERETDEVRERRVRTECGCILVVPLLRQTRILGTMTLINAPNEPNFSKEDVAITETIAHYCSIVVENARMLFELKQANRAKSEFLSIVSHELRTPLTSILGFSELLQKTELSSEQRQYAHVIEVGGTALLTVINDILDYSNIELGKLEIVRAPFSLKRLVDDVTLLFRARANETNVEFDVRRNGLDVDEWEGDENRIRQIAINLLSNAFKFTERGRVDFSIAVGVTNAGVPFVELSVRDTGIGISAEAQSKLFRPFTQSESVNSRKYGGTGLGLSICKRLCDLMGATIAVESQLGVGSVFTVTFAQPGAEGNASDSNFQRRRSLRILIVDDSEMNRFVVSQTLKTLGHRYEVAFDGQAALDLCEIERYDLILMDISMPELDGIETTLRLRDESTLNRETPVVAFTASVVEENWERCRRAGMADLLEKPFNAAQLAQVIDRTVRS